MWVQNPGLGPSLSALLDAPHPGAPTCYPGGLALGELQLSTPPGPGCVLDNPLCLCPPRFRPAGWSVVEVTWSRHTDALGDTEPGLAGPQAPRPSPRGQGHPCPAYTQGRTRGSREASSLSPQTRSKWGSWPHAPVLTGCFPWPLAGWYVVLDPREAVAGGGGLPRGLRTMCL